MAKSKYYTHVEPKLDLVQAWARDGLIDEQIAINLGIGNTSFHKYKKEYPEFYEALKKGKEVVDFEVENALLKRALGYKYTETTKERGIDPVTGAIELIVTKEVVKEVVPDTTAQIFWLKNRKPKVWKDKQDIGIEGNVNGVLEVVVKPPNPPPSLNRNNDYKNRE